MKKIIILILVLSFSIPLFSKDNGISKVEKNYSIAAIKTINLKWENLTLEIKEGADEKLNIEISSSDGKFSYNDKIEDGKLEISVIPLEKKGIIFKDPIEIKGNIFIPKNFRGSISLEGLNGDVKLKNILGNMSLYLTNGYVQGENISRIKNIKMTNGNVNISNSLFVKGGVITLDNGDVDASFNELEGNNSITVKNGTITLKLPKEKTLEYIGEKIKLVNINGRVNIRSKGAD